MSSLAKLTRHRLAPTLGCLLVLLSAATSQAESKMPTAQIGNNNIKLEVSSSPQQIEKGLMYRTAMPEDHGMVFIFHPARGVKFWMHNCYMPLDMMMIKDGKVIKIFENVRPEKDLPADQCPTYPDQSSDPLVVSEVIEVNGGYAKRHGVKEGASVKFSLGVTATPAQ